MFKKIFSKPENFRQELSDYIFENSPDCVCVLREGKVVEFNDAFAQIMRQPRETLMGLTPPEFSPEFQLDGNRSDAMAMQYITRAMQDGHHRFEWRIRRADNSQFSVNVTLMRWQRGEETLLIFVWQDIEEVVQLRGREAEQMERMNHQAAQDQKTIVALAEGLKALAAGRLFASIDQMFDPKTEPLRKDFNEAAASLCRAIEEIASVAGSMSKSSREIGSATRDLASRTERQAASLEEAAASIKQIVASISATADFARKAKGLVDMARGDSAAIGTIVERAVASMEQISRSSSEIGKIIGVIDEIAFQTNLLALNAGVEAARAGEAGKGFAVVAQEVRELAQRSASAAKEIRLLVTTSERQVKDGVELVGETGGALSRIAGHVEEIGSAVGQIEKSAQEEDVAIREINKMIADIDQVTQHNTAMVEETVAAIHSLNEDVGDVEARVAKFELRRHEAQSIRRYA
ncbi:PAS domain S-box-containing protein [Ensifer adhaerens]|nr:PAS domain S-box-containing protein [Ensifer adhaerens]